MNEFIEGIRVRNSKVVFLGVAAIVLLVLALICFFNINNFDTQRTI